MHANDLRARDFRRILLIKLSAVGDVVHTIPVLNKLRRRYPSARIDWLVTPAIAELIRHHPAVSNVVLFMRDDWSTPWRPAAIGRVAKLAAELRRARYDLIVDMHGQFRTAFFTLAASAPVRIGFDRPRPEVWHASERTFPREAYKHAWKGARELSWIAYTHRIPVPTLDVHAVDRYLTVGSMLGLDDGPADFSFPVPADAVARVEALLATHGIMPGAGVLLCAPGTNWETKHWSAERFAEVARHFLARGWRIVLIGSERERAVCARVAAAAPGTVDLCGQTSLTELAALVRRSSGAITNDSGPMHMAVALDRPVVSIFGPTDALWIGPYRRADAVLRVDLPCAPCYLRQLRHCRHDHACMNEITAAQVIERMESVLATGVDGPDHASRGGTGGKLSTPMDGTLTATWFDRARLERAADLLAVAVLVSIPWSTTATAVLVVLWLMAFVPTLDWPTVRRELWTPAGGLPVLFFLLAAVGMLWADASWRERLGGLDSFHRLLVIPLLLAQFRRSGNGHWAVYGFFASCTVLLVASYVHFVWRSADPAMANATFLPGPVPIFPGVPVKEYILQSGEFQLCAFGLAYAAVEAWRAQKRRLAWALGLLACAFLANIVYIVTGRTAVVVMPVLLALFGLRLFGWRGVIGVAIAGVLLAAVAWFSSPYLRWRISNAQSEVYLYWTENKDTSAGERLEFWRKSLRFVAAAPLIGHGTGSITQQFRGAVGTSGPSTIISENPHQQTLTVAVQLGLLGVIVLYAMWIAHLVLFRGGELIGWCGLLVVAQNIVSSLFNSYLFDFTQGWLYVFGVGILGGAVLNLRARKPAASE